jgi:hypothetical protein
MTLGTALLKRRHVRPDSRPEFMTELQVRAELRDGAFCQFPEVGGSAP